MGHDFSFDISCDFDKQEFQNAIDQARREVTNRFDFKGVLAEIEINEAKELILHTESKLKINALIDIIESRLIKRNLPISILDKSKESEDSAGNTLKKHIRLVSTLDSEQLKEISKLIREVFPKVKPQIQGDTLRVVSGSKDDLQDIMKLLRDKKSDLPLQFSNFR